MFLSTLSNLTQDTTNSESKRAASWLTQKLAPTKSNILFILFIITVCVRCPVSVGVHIQQFSCRNQRPSSKRWFPSFTMGSGDCTQVIRRSHRTFSC